MTQSTVHYDVIETWDVSIGEIKIFEDEYAEENESIAMSFIKYLTKLSNGYYLNFGIERNKDHLQLHFQDTDDDESYEIELHYGNDYAIVYKVDFIVNVYNNKSFSAGFHYTTNEHGDDIDKAMYQMLEDICNILKLKNMIIDIERRVVDISTNDEDFGSQNYESSLNVRKSVGVLRNID